MTHHRRDKSKERRHCQKKSESEECKPEKGHRGRRGPTGPKGSTGATGPAGTAEGFEFFVEVAPGPNDDPTGTAVVTDGERILFWSETLDITVTPGSAIVNIEDNRQVSGPTGPEGAKGDVGCRGPQGCKGDQGEDGCRGPRGKRGCQGATGVGATGPAGADGRDGQQGPEGPEGPTGEPGAPGPTGPAGNPTNTGVAFAQLLREDSNPATGFSVVTVDGNLVEASFDAVATSMLVSGSPNSAITTIQGKLSVVGDVAATQFDVTLNLALFPELGVFLPTNVDTVGVPVKLLSLHSSTNPTPSTLTNQYAFSDWTPTGSPDLILSSFVRDEVEGWDIQFSWTYTTDL